MKFVVLFLGFLSVLCPLYAGEYSADWKAFVQVIDKEYPFFQLKGIKNDWNREKKVLGKRADAAKEDEEFLVVVMDALKVLRDGHAGFRKTRVEIPASPPEFCLPIALMPGEKGQVVIMDVMRSPSVSSLKPGMVVTSIDGKPARKMLEEQAGKLWDEGGFFSSPQRARLLVYRQPLASETVTEHKIVCEQGAKKSELILKNDFPIRGRVAVYNMPQGLKRGEGRSLYAELPSGVGYIYLRSIQGDMTVAGIKAALKDIPDVKGWIIDLRGNGGGGYGEEMHETLNSIPSPVAVILDAGCFSAGETVARDLKARDACLFGAVTAGSSTKKRIWNFPSGVGSLSLPVRSHFGPDKKPIEYNGIKPDVEMEAVPAEVANGQNSEILAAEKYLLGRKK